MDGWKVYGNHKMTDPEGRVFVKVVGFPSASGGTESMWVILTDGDENDGVGTLDNVPLDVPGVSLGTPVRFGGGTASAKPEYLGRADR